MVKLVVFLLGFLQLVLQFIHALLGLELLPHPVLYRGFVQGLIGRQGHFMLVSHPHQQQPPFRAVDGHLSSDLVEGLAEQLLSYSTDAFLAGLPMLECLLKGLFEFEDVIPGGLGVAYVLHEELVVVCPPVPRSDHVV